MWLRLACGTAGRAVAAWIPIALEEEATRAEVDLHFSRRRPPRGPGGVEYWSGATDDRRRSERGECPILTPLLQIPCKSGGSMRHARRGSRHRAAGSSRGRVIARPARPGTNTDPCSPAIDGRHLLSARWISRCRRSLPPALRCPRTAPSLEGACLARGNGPDMIALPRRPATRPLRIAKRAGIGATSTQE